MLRNPDSPLGVLKDYFYRVELKQRGSHIHMLAWITNAPHFNNDSKNEHVDYIDKVASCSSNVTKEDEIY